jgi:methylated-DNA-[protein]-cysteine S-methyltransferase
MTAFAERVYKAVLSVPFGETRTYKWVAKKAGRPKACRAVGNLMKNNPLPLLIPCHRVVKGSGHSGGYIFGAKKKRLLLEAEKKIAWLLNKE